MNNRLEQLSIAYKKALGAILLREFPHLAVLTVTDVLIDPSGKTGRVWLSTTPDTLKEVNQRRSDIQGQLKKHVVTRYTPKLTFLLDDRYLDHIDNLLSSIVASRLLTRRIPPCIDNRSSDQKATKERHEN